MLIKRRRVCKTRLETDNLICSTLALITEAGSVGWFGDRHVCISHPKLISLVISAFM
jgi:hypothetical protein